MGEGGKGRRRGERASERAFCMRGGQVRWSCNAECPVLACVTEVSHRQAISLPQHLAHCMPTFLPWLVSAVYVQAPTGLAAPARCAAGEYPVRGAMPVPRVPEDCPQVGARVRCPAGAGGHALVVLLPTLAAATPRCSSGPPPLPGWPPTLPERLHPCLVCQLCPPHCLTPAPLSNLTPPSGCGGPLPGVRGPGPQQAAHSRGPGAAPGADVQPAAEAVNQGDCRRRLGHP